MATLTTKQMSEAISAKYDAIPNAQVSTGVYLKTVGRKYVTLVDTWGTTSTKKIEIEEFYDEYVAPYAFDTIEDWLADLRESLYDGEIVAGLENGDVQCPDWISYTPCTALGFAVCDNRIPYTSIHYLDAEDVPED